MTEVSHILRPDGVNTLRVDVLVATVQTRILESYRPGKTMSFQTKAGYSDEVYRTVADLYRSGGWFVLIIRRRQLKYTATEEWSDSIWFHICDSEIMGVVIPASVPERTKDEVIA